MFQLDLFGNGSLIRILARDGLTGILGSKEFAAASRLPTKRGASDFVVTLDPLDGYSNLD